MAEPLEIIITADTRNAERNIGGLGKALGGLGGILSGALKVGLGAAIAGIGLLGTGLGFAISEAIEAEAVFAQTAAVIESTGGIAGITAEAAADLAESLSEVTRFGDEAILSGENILLTFTNIGQDVFPTATQTMLDMSQALGQDLQSSAIQLGKALQDPILGVSALRRVGVNFTEDQQELIKSLVESGNLLEAQSMILRELQVEFGGSAEAAGQTFGGQIDILRNKIGNLAETIGSRLLTIMQGPLGDAFTTLSGIIDKVGAEGGPLDRVLNAFGQMTQNMEYGMSPLDAFRNAFAQLLPPEVIDMLDQLIVFFDELQLALEQEAMQTALKTLGENLAGLGLTSVEGTLGVLLNTLVAFSGFLVDNGPAIATILGALAFAISFMTFNIKNLVDMVDVWIDGMGQLFNLDFEGAFQTFEDFSARLMERIVQLFADTPLEAVAGFIQGLRDAAGPLNEAIKGIGISIEKALKDALGIQSPSTVFAELGKFTMQGLALGISTNAGLPQMAVAGAGAGMVSSVQNSTQLNNYGNIYPTVQESASLGSLLESTRRAAQPS